MYAYLNNVVTQVSTFGGSNAETTTIVYQNQSNLQYVLDNIGTEIRLYDDNTMQTLAAIYNNVEALRATIDLNAHTVAVTISASRLSELETEQLKQDMATQQILNTENDDALIELAGMVEETFDAIAELGEVFETFKMEVEARLEALEGATVEEETQYIE